LEKNGTNGTNGMGRLGNERTQQYLVWFCYKRGVAGGYNLTITVI
jgi:hypothetical protein